MVVMAMTRMIVARMAMAMPVIVPSMTRVGVIMGSVLMLGAQN